MREGGSGSKKLPQKNGCMHNNYLVTETLSYSRGFFFPGEYFLWRVMGMCHWTGSHFHYWIDYNVVAFSIELLD